MTPMTPMDFKGKVESSPFQFSFKKPIGQGSGFMLRVIPRHEWVQILFQGKLYTLPIF